MHGTKEGGRQEGRSFRFAKVKGGRGSLYFRPEKRPEGGRDTEYVNCKKDPRPTDRPTLRSPSHIRRSRAESPSLQNPLFHLYARLISSSPPSRKSLLVLLPSDSFRRVDPGMKVSPVLLFPVFRCQIANWESSLDSNGASPFRP